MSFDPETDKTLSPNRATVKRAYEALLRRGEEDRAEALRTADSLDEQLTLAGDVREFDPEADPADSASKLDIKRVYDALLAAGHEDAAAALR